MFTYQKLCPILNQLRPKNNKDASILITMKAKKKAQRFKLNDYNRFYKFLWKMGFNKQPLTFQFCDHTMEEVRTKNIADVYVHGFGLDIDYIKGKSYIDRDGKTVYKKIHIYDHLDEVRSKVEGILAEMGLYPNMYVKSGNGLHYYFNFSSSVNRSLADNSAKLKFVTDKIYEVITARTNYKIDNRSSNHPFAMFGSITKPGARVKVVTPVFIKKEQVDFFDDIFVHFKDEFEASLDEIKIKERVKKTLMGFTCVDELTGERFTPSIAGDDKITDEIRKVRKIKLYNHQRPVELYDQNLHVILEYRTKKRILSALINDKQSFFKRVSIHPKMARSAMLYFREYVECGNRTNFLNIVAIMMTKVGYTGEHIVQEVLKLANYRNRNTKVKDTHPLTKQDVMYAISGVLEDPIYAFYMKLENIQELQPHWYNNWSKYAFNALYEGNDKRLKMYQGRHLQKARKKYHDDKPNRDAKQKAIVYYYLTKKVNPSRKSLAKDLHMSNDKASYYYNLFEKDGEPNINNVIESLSSKVIDLLNALFGIYGLIKYNLFNDKRRGDNRTLLERCKESINVLLAKIKERIARTKTEIKNLIKYRIENRFYYFADLNQDEKNYILKNNVFGFCDPQVFLKNS